MKSIRIIVAFIIFSLLFINCQNKNYDNFFENEKLRLIDAAEETIEKLGLENFEILAYTHKSISNEPPRGKPRGILSVALVRTEARSIGSLLYRLV